MTEYARLVISVDSKQVTQARTEVDKTTASAGRAEKAARALGVAVAGMVSIQAIRSAQQLSEQFVLLQSRIQRMSGSVEEARITYNRLGEIARTTGSDMAETVRLWESLTGTLRELGATDAQVVRLTETLQKIGTVGGSSAEEMANALRQLGQGLAGGVLRAEEFNAIVEGMPELAREIGRGLGVPFGELRQQMMAGELTAERVLGAIQSRASSVDAEFAKLPRTLSQASTALTNDLGRAISELDKAIGGSSSLAAFLDVLTKGIRFTAGDLTDYEKLNQLLAEREQLQTRYEQAERRTLLSAGERSALENRLKKLNEEILEIQNRRVQQQKQENAESGKSGGAARNEEYDKYLAKLAESAALQGENSEAAKVRYAIESGAIGKLAPEQEAALLRYAEEIDRKRAAGVASETLARSNEQLEQSYDATALSLSRQLELYGLTSEAAKVRYELESGSLKGIVSQQAQYLMGLAQELDAKRDLTEQEQIRIDILRESGQLRAANDAQFQLEYAEKIAEYERQGNVEALQRLETLRRIREIQMAADQVPGTVEGVSSAPGTRGVDAVVSGPSGELMKLEQDALELEQWRATELEKHRGFLEAKAITEQEYLIREQNVYQQHQNRIAQIEAARQQVQLAAGEAFFSNMAGLTAVFAGEQSDAYKAMFAIEKGYALAKVLMNAPKTASDAYSAMAGIPYIGPALGVAAAAAALSYQAAQASGIRSVSLSGMAHDGIDSIPSEGTWLLDKGERVVDRRTNADLKDYLAGKGGGGSPQITIQAPVTVEGQAGMSEAEARQQGQITADAINAVVMTRIERESRPGGLLWNLYGAGR